MQIGMPEFPPVVSDFKLKLRLCKSQRVEVRISDIELASAPALIDRAFVDLLRSLGTPRRLQPAFSELDKHGINVTGRDDDSLTELAVPAMAREDQLVAFTREKRKAGIVQIVIRFSHLEVEHAGVEGEGCPHVSATNVRYNRHHPSIRIFQRDADKSRS